MASTPEDSSRKDVETAKAATRSAIERVAGKDAAQQTDLSYITAELLEEYRNAPLVPRSALPAQRGASNPPGVKKGPNDTWTFYGHHVVQLDQETGEWGWTNPNKDYSHPDRPDYRCFGEKGWRYYISQCYFYPSCPQNSQGYNSDSFGADPKL